MTCWFEIKSISSNITFCKSHLYETIHIFVFKKTLSVGY